LSSLVLQTKRQLARARRVYGSTLRSLVRPDSAPDGLPLPPPSLRFLAVGATDMQTFIRGGETVARMITQTLARHGVAMQQLSALLDFGVGCGRVLRNWKGLAAQGVEIHGTDYNPKLVAWCHRGLPFASFEVNGLAPPLPYEDARFDLVYSYSVFTHLPEEIQPAWAQELRRVLRPSGLLLFTTHGTPFAKARLTAEELERFSAGELVVRAPTAAGTNPYAAFHPERYVRDRLAAGFTVLEFAEGAGPSASAGGRVRQDVHLLRKAAP
jgi:SAM-dependent methyltransferase